MSAFASRWHDWLGGLAAAGRPARAAGSIGTRPAARPLLTLDLLTPVLLAAGLVQALADTLGAAKIVALVILTIGAGWLARFLMDASRYRPAGEAAGLAIVAACTAAIVAGAGGLASPLAMLLAMPLAEALWMRRDRTGLIAGAAASAIALAGAVAGAALLDAAQQGAASAWHWFVPVSYAAVCAARSAMVVRDRDREIEARRPLSAEDVIDAAVLRLSRNGEVLEVSGRAETLLGLQPALLLGSSLAERIHVGDRVAYLCALSELRDGCALRKLDLRLRSPRPAVDENSSENYRHFAAEIAWSGDPERPALAVLRADDENAALRMQVATLRADADELDVAKSRFLAVVSHELRTPLNAIIGFSDMLAQEMFGPFANPRQKEYAGLIRESGTHLLSVVTSILDVSKIECGSYPIEPEAFQFREAVITCRSMMALLAASKSVTLDTDIAATVGNVVADRRAVQQMLINLISNAIKFTPAGGQVTIGAKRLGSRLHFWVGDTGIGISEEDLGRLGRPFTQVRNDYTREYDGAGLGLSLVKGLVALHEGSMTIESAPGEGTVVTISLPVAGPSGRRTGGDAANVIRLRNDEGADGQVRKIA